MFTLRHIARTSVVGLALSAGVGGCMHERHPNIPASAMMVSSGNEVAFTAPQDGMVYVHDTTDNRLLYAGSVKSGQMLTVDEKMNRLTLDGKTVQDETLRTGHTRKIYFEATGRKEESMTETRIESRTRTERMDSDR